MQLNENKKLNNQDSLSPRIGYSDMRMHGAIMLAMIFTLALAPLFGVFASICLVMIFGLFAAFKVADFQYHSLKSYWIFKLEMDRIYNRGLESKRYNDAIATCDEIARYENSVISVPNVKKVIIEKPEKFIAKNRAKLVLNLVNR